MLKRLIKNSIKAIVRCTLHVLPQLPGGNYVSEQLLVAGMNESGIIQHKGVRMIFTTPNSLCRYRVESFSTKEPDTLEWIEEMPIGSILWDIGANVGLYSIYAAMARDCKVFAFEPSVFNLELLARNINLNKAQQKIVIMPIALTDKIGSSLFNMSSTAWGGALSTFGEDFDQHGDVLQSTFQYETMGISMTDAHNLLKIPLPKYIKVDVDGIEHFILRGGFEILKIVESVLIEIDDDFVEQAEESIRILQNVGLTLLRKCRLGSGNQYNQWWVRKRP